MDPRIVRRKLDLLSGLAIVESRQVADWRACTAQHLQPGHYQEVDAWHATALPTGWPAQLTVFLESAVEVPSGWDPARTFLTFSFRDLEGLLSVDGRPWAGLDYAHNLVLVPGPGRHDLRIEFQSVPQAFWEAGARQNQSLFQGARLVLVDPEVEAAYYDLRFAFETGNVVHDERRRALLAAALEDAMLAINLAAPPEESRREARAARGLLAERLGQIGRDPEGGRLLLTGHTHIDTAWLWPLRETVRKCSRTFATACRLMERYPDYHFACSQAQLYAYTKRYYPDLFAEIRRWVAAGRWENTGAMWVEPDANVISGESMVRQILYGLAFFREEFGTRPTLCWLPDVFGYNGNMPQILAGCGLRSFWTWKLHWQSRNPFPYHLFWWEGIDGSRVMAHIPKLGGGAYNGTPSPEQLARAWETYLQKGGYPEQLFPFGFGDGGGGVTAEMMEFANRAADYPGLPRCRQGTAEQFFTAAHAAAPDLPVWIGELYLETHRGTYTTQGRTKRANRACEVALRDAEIWGTLARLGAAADPLAGLGELAQALRCQWETVLLHQFHDILPGSSIGEVYVDTAADHARVLSEAAAVRAAALRELAEGPAAGNRFRVFNSLSWDRQDVVRLPAGDLSAPVVVDGAGNALSAQVIQAGDGHREIAAIVAVPALGMATVEVRSGQPAASAVRSSGRTLENEFLLAEIGVDGTLVRLLDKRLGREVIPAGQCANCLQLFQDGPEREAAWNIHATYARREYAWDGPCTVEPTEAGPARAVIRVTRSHRATRLVQDIILWAGLPRLDFHTRVDWHERQTLLKVAFPVAVRALHATFEIQYGALERATHRNTSWEQEKFEVCAQRWADLSEGGYGVSLLNDCRYGHDVCGNILRLSLLRGTEFPDPEADQGAHEFTYTLLPHEGDWRQGQTVRRAAELNVPLTAVPSAVTREPLSYLRVEGPAVLETLKPAEDGEGVILRFYEPNGARGRVTVTHGLPFAQVVHCNLVEEDGEPVTAEPGRFAFEAAPFRISTFRLRP